MALVIFAESVALSKAVTFWSTYQSYYGDNRRKNGGDFETPFSRAARQAEECANVMDGRRVSTICSQPSLPPSRAFRFSKRVTTLRRLAEDCCLECSNCMESTQVAALCNIPRGGHLVGVDNVVEAAAKVVASSSVAPYNIPLNGWKIIFQIMLTFMNVACWLIPLRSKKISDNKLALSLANAFSGGVFLSLAFGHLIPECVHGFSGYNEATPYMLVLTGYLLIFFVEKVAFDTHDILHEFESGEAAKVAKAEHKHNGDATPSSGRSAVILLGALAVHSILEMMALGLGDTFGECGLLTLSIALHQPAESIALLVAFLKSGMSKPEIVKYLSIFSAMGPIGVAIGMAVNEFAAPIVDAIMLAIVAGTFVYVGATEVIPEEWENSENKWKKFAALMLGISSIFAITQYTMSLNVE